LEPSVATAVGVLVTGDWATIQGWHAPKEHVPPPQLWPQAPQLAGSLPLKLTQPLVHIVVPPGHLQLLMEQVVPFMHEFPHEPQLLLSLVVSTQALVALQYVVFPATGHAGTHFVPSHDTVPPPLGAVHAVQLVPHALVSLATQPLGHTWLGLVHWHMLLRHCSPLRQACPHVPQFELSLERSAQPPAHEL
jgi:hypothetical protein